MSESTLESESLPLNCCEFCKDIIEQPNIPHVITKCEHCGRVLRITRPGPHGKGFTISKGDQFVIPAKWLTLSFNPLKSTCQFSRYGLDLFAKMVFIEEIFKHGESIEDNMRVFEERMDKIVNDSPLVQPLDINNESDSQAIHKLLIQHPATIEYWAMYAGYFLAQAREARIQHDLNQATWATACAERCRMMVLYKEHLEDVVIMGQSARRLIDAINTWQSNRTNSDEEFWQLTFSEHTYVLSQVFAMPLVFIKQKAYVGGMKLDQNDAKIVDYLFASESSREAVLIEIKTPTAKLMNSSYRNGVHSPSSELSGSVVQVLTYKYELFRNMRALVEDREYDVKAFNPKCVVVIGNGEDQLTDKDMRRSFELFRSSSDVEIVTFDELFRKVEILAQLFGLTKKHK
jgi:hypothetical protein